MKKTKCVFDYDFENNVLLSNASIGNEWVLTEDAIPTLKHDGSACLFKDGILWKRHDRKLNKKYINKFKAGDKPEISCFKEAPEGFIPCEESYDPHTFHWPGWVPVGKFDKYHLEALENIKDDLVEGCTYELMGPNVAKNTANIDKHMLFKHGDVVLDIRNKSFEGLKKYLSENYIEGIVFHNKKDGRVAKITRRHFGMFWKELDNRKSRLKRK